MIPRKTGRPAGFMICIAFAPGRDVGVFVAVDRIDLRTCTGLTEGANELIAMLAPR
jgi:serine-type D-Ala-D-Ala carboxypeptidase/endopeptidase